MISEEFEERIDRVLGRPATDPHGSPIPGRDGKIKERDLISLTDIEMGRSVVIRWVRGQEPERLQYLESLGLLPDVVVKVFEKKPFNGPLLIQIGSSNKREMIGQELAQQIWVGIKKN